MKIEPIRVIVPDDDFDSGYITQKGIEKYFGDRVNVAQYQQIADALQEIERTITEGRPGIVVSDVHMGLGPRAYVQIFDLYNRLERALPTIFTTSVVNQVPRVNNLEPGPYRPEPGETLGALIMRVAPDFAPVEAIQRGGYRDSRLYTEMAKIVPSLGEDSYQPASLEQLSAQ